MCTPVQSYIRDHQPWIFCTLWTTKIPYPVHHLSIFSVNGQKVSVSCLFHVDHQTMKNVGVTSTSPSPQIDPLVHHDRSLVWVVHNVAPTNPTAQKQGKVINTPTPKYICPCGKILSITWPMVRFFKLWLSFQWPSSWHSTARISALLHPVFFFFSDLSSFFSASSFSVSVWNIKRIE